VLGAGAAIIVYIMLSSKFSSMLGKLIPDDINKMGVMTIYLIALVSGMTERFVLKVVEKITK
jgi:hypothetical protein